MEWIFFGTDEFAVEVLEGLFKNNIIPSKIVSAPDFPERRKKGLVPPPTKVWAIDKNIEILQPNKLDNDFIESIKDCKYDFFVVASYGKIIPKSVLDIPSRGTLNIHPSLLPKYRGASPVESAILDDEKNTGVTIMEMDEKMDHGPIVSQVNRFYEKWPEAKDVRLELARIGTEELSRIIPLWLSGEIRPVEQDHRNATYTKKYQKEDSLINLDDDPYENFRKIRAFSGWYNAYFLAEKSGKSIRVVIHDADLVDNKLVIKKVVPEGKKEMDWEQFQNFLTQ